MGRDDSQDTWAKQLPATVRGLSNNMVLSRDEIQIWRFSLERPQAEVERLLEILEGPERDRAERISIERFRRRFVCAHGLVRVTLGRCLGESPRELRFETGPNGKPALREARADLRFNLSHSGEMAVLAIARGREIGVDIEEIRSNVDFATLAERFFRPEETAALGRVAEDQRAEAFFRAWTCKEAYVKARGLRLPPNLSEVGVTIDPDGPAAFTCLPAAEPDGEPAAGPGVDAWFLEMFVPEPGFIGAVCAQRTADVEGASLALHNFDSPAP